MIPDINQDIFDYNITKAELIKAITTAKSGKSVGCDELPTEVLRSDIVINFLLILFNKCYDEGIIPDLWSKGIINPIPKSSTTDTRDPMPYRGITLAPASYKLYCSVLNERLRLYELSAGNLSDCQNGFRKERITIDHLSTLTSLFVLIGLM